MIRILTVVAVLAVALAVVSVKANNLLLLGTGPGGTTSSAPLTNLRIIGTGDFRITGTADNRAVSP